MLYVCVAYTPYTQVSYFFIFGTTAPPPPPQWAKASSFTRFLDRTQWRTTVGKTPLDEWLARRRDLFLTTHNTHNRQTAVGIEPTILAGELLQTYALDPRGHWGRLFYFTYVKFSRVKMCLLMNGSGSIGGVRGSTVCSVKTMEWEHNVMFNVILKCIW